MSFLSQLYDNSTKRPGFFEMVVQDQLTNGVKPALTYAFSVVAQRSPRWDFVVRNNDLLWSSFLLVLESRYLGQYGATFAENFYSLRRANSLDLAADPDAIGTATRAQVAGARKRPKVSPLDGGPGGGGGGGGGGGLWGGGAAVDLKDMDPLHTLSPNEQWAALASMVIIPFLKCRLDAHYKELVGPLGPFALAAGGQQGLRAGDEGGGGFNVDFSSVRLPEEEQLDSEQQQQEEEEENQSSAISGNQQRRVPARAQQIRTAAVRLRCGFTRWFARLYPHVSAAYEGSFFAYQMFYLVGQTDYFSPLYHLVGHKLRRQTQVDMQAVDSYTTAARKSVRADIAAFEGRAARRGAFFALLARGMAVLWRGGVGLREFLADNSFTGFIMLLYMFQTLQWYYTNADKVPQQKLRIPPPRKAPVPHPDGAALPDEKGKCPLSGGALANPALLPSGYVFSYAPLYRYVQEHNRCPITFAPYVTDDIRRIYDDSF